MPEDFQAQFASAARLERDDVPIREQQVAEPASLKRRFDLRSAVLMVAGGLLTGSLIASSFVAGAPTPAAFTLQQVATEDLDAASQSLVSTSAAALVDEAKSCRRPLAFLLIRSTAPGTGTVRFRSGAYVSPNLRLGFGVERIALPFPAPYEVGHGQITIENNSGGADIFLTPGFTIGAGPGTATANVHWNPKAPC